MQSAVPLVIAAVGGSFASQVGVFNLGLEGMMIAGAFGAFSVAHTTGSVWLGLLGGIAAGLLVAVIFAISTVYFRADEVVTGFLINLAMLALTAVLLTALFGATGQLVSTTFGNLPKFGRFDIMMVVAVATVLAAQFVTYHSRFGLRMRAVGGNPDAAEAVGVHPDQTRIYALLACGGLAGMAGAYLPLSGLHMFTINMTAGAGYIAVAAVLFGVGRPGLVALAALLFGFMGAIAVPMQRLEMPSEFALILPYLATLVAVSVKGIILFRRSHGASELVAQ
ncbi:ABC transporter permease [Actinomyces sp.]|uniref:ABC transporter permease n=1 Tax=Actinomyces sp. TaxID=29317 RepID=UPI00293123CB|nr:ABC transporter permease [Actinomyces sp.]